MKLLQADEKKLSHNQAKVSTFYASQKQRGRLEIYYNTKNITAATFINGAAYFF